MANNKGKVDPKLLAVGGAFAVTARPSIIVGSRQREDFPGLAEALNDMHPDHAVSWELDESLVEPMKLKLQRWLRGKNLNEHFAVVTDGEFVHIVRK